MSGDDLQDVSFDVDGLLTEAEAIEETEFDLGDDLTPPVSNETPIDTSNPVKAIPEKFYLLIRDSGDDTTLLNVLRTLNEAETTKKEVISLEEDGNVAIVIVQFDATEEKLTVLSTDTSNLGLGEDYHSTLVDKLRSEIVKALQDEEQEEVTQDPSSLSYLFSSQKLQTGLKNATNLFWFGVEKSKEITKGIISLTNELSL